MYSQRGFLTVGSAALAAAGFLLGCPVLYKAPIAARRLRGIHCYQIDLAFGVREDLGITQHYSRALREVVTNSRS